MLSLIIMAAGLGTRYKGGVKALAGVGPDGELLFDYGVFDALEAGFKRIVFVVRKDIEQDFMSVYGERIRRLCGRYGAEMKCVVQNLGDIPEGTVPEGRVKPWGTCHAVLAARDVIDGPFCVMNADDYYGKAAFAQAYAFFSENTDDDLCCMAGFRLLNTLSDNGGVTRGICIVDEKGYVSSIKETRHVIKDGDGASADGVQLVAESRVSMNFWGFNAGMMQLLRDGFADFLKSLNAPMTDEFLLPVFVNRLIAEKRLHVKLLESPDRWFGMTYSSDKEATSKAVCELVRNGVYPEKLFE